MWKSLKSFYPSLKQRFPELYEASEYGSDKPRSVVVREGDHLRLRCAANGFPPPNVEWVREDEKTISTGAWEATSMPGHTLNITKVNRVHMGTYRCIADNGIPPAANQTYQVDVYCEYRTWIIDDRNFPALNWNPEKFMAGIIIPWLDSNVLSTQLHPHRLSLPFRLDFPIKTFLVIIVSRFLERLVSCNKF